MAIQKSGFDGRCRGLPRSVLHWGVGHDVPDAPQKKPGVKLQRLASGTSNCHFIFEFFSNIRELLTKEITEFLAPLIFFFFACARGSRAVTSRALL
jgi:hypothetical protein